MAGSMETFFQDLRYGLRMLVKSPGFTAIAILTLALGIGANTALFSVVNGVLLNPLAYPRSGQLVAVYGKSPGFDRAPITYLNFLDCQRNTETFQSMAMYRNQDYSYIGTGEAGERLTGYQISADFFPTLSVAPIVGRTFRADDDRLGAAPVVILGGGLWKREFGSSLDVVGKSIVLNGTSYIVVGVIPPGFTFYGQDRDVYTPIGQYNDPSFRDRGIGMSAHAVGRLKPGVTLSQAKTDMDGIAANLAEAFPEADKSVGITLFSMKEDIVGNVQPFLIVLLAAVGFLLLIACANVANLLLARAMGRSREFAVRAAMGASHARVIRQLLTESMLLAGLGGALGILLAFWGIRAVLGTLPGAVPRANEVSLDSRVLLFTMALSLFAGIVFGLAPALKTSRANLQEVLKESGRGGDARHRLQGVFVAGEVAMALVLLVGAGLMVRSLAALWRVDPGFNPSHAITFALSMPSTDATTSSETRARLRHFDDALGAIPGVQAVSVTLGSRPMIHNSTLPFWIEGQSKPANLQEMPQVMFYLVEGGFQQAMGITLLRGRFVTPQDDEHSSVVVDIDDVFARSYFPGENPIGKHIHLATFDVTAEIVGVVGHVKQWGLDADSKSAIEAQLDYPFMQLPEKLMPMVADSVAVVLRTEGDPTAVMGSVRRAVEEIDPREVIYNVRTMDEVVSSSFAARRLSMLLLSIFAALALVLACVGIYGVISYLVTQRTHEIGVRMALGAERSDVLRLVIGHGARMALVGVTIGVGAALGLTRLMASQLFGVSAYDPLTFAAVAMLLIVVAIAACYIPARRAMRVDPMIALRHE
jgi:predicted permease